MHSVPVIGPVIGGLLGAFVYEALFNKAISIGLWVVVVVFALVVILAFTEAVRKNT